MASVSTSSTTFVKAKRWAAAALALCSTTGCEELFGAEEDLYINSRMYQVPPESVLSTPGALQEFTGPAGRTCSNVGAGSGTGASGSNGPDQGDFWMHERTNSMGLSVVIGTFDEVLENRRYGLDFISAYEMERFIVTTRMGDQYAFTYWGSDTCDNCPPGEYEALPGDPWGCGSAGNEGAGSTPPSIDR
jgi:hypothetical protein